MMTAAGATSVVVRARRRVARDPHRPRSAHVASSPPGSAADAPVTAAMSAPAYTCPPDRLGGEVLLDMLDRGFRHFPVVIGAGEVLGRGRGHRPVAVQTRSSFFLRRRIGRAQTVDDLIGAAAELRPMVVALHDARVAALERDGGLLGRRRRADPAAARARGRRRRRAAGRAFAWLGARQPGTPRDAAELGRRQRDRVVRGRPGDRGPARTCTASARPSSADLERCGFRIDEHGATRVQSPVRALAGIVAARGAQLDRGSDPGEGADPHLGARRQPAGVGRAHRNRRSPTRSVSPAEPRSCCACSPGSRSPIGRRPGSSAGSSSARRRAPGPTLDLKHGGVIPIIDLARWAGMAAGVTSASTAERLRAGADAGQLSADHAHTLEDAFELVSTLRLAHQVEQLRAGRDAGRLRRSASAQRSLTRSHLKEAFRAVASIQKRVSGEPSGTRAMNDWRRVPAGDLGDDARRRCDRVVSPHYLGAFLIGGAIGIAIRIRQRRRQRQRQAAERSGGSRGSGGSRVAGLGGARLGGVRRARKAGPGKRRSR